MRNGLKKIITTGSDKVCVLVLANNKAVGAEKSLLFFIGRRSCFYLLQSPTTGKEAK